MIVDHNHPLYIKKRKSSGNDKFNGAYYYSKEIVKNFIPNINTDRNWITVNIPSLEGDWDHSIVFIHNNRNPNYYSWLKKYKDLILVCGIPQTCENMRFYGKPVYLPLSVDVKNVKKHKKAHKTKNMGFAGRMIKLNNHVPNDCDVLSGMSQTRLLDKMSRYKKIYAVGRTAIQARILGCEIGVYDERFPDPKFWKVVDNSEAVKILQQMIDEIDKNKS